MYVTTSFLGSSLPLSMEEKRGNEIEYFMSQAYQWRILEN